MRPEMDLTIPPVTLRDGEPEPEPEPEPAVTAVDDDEEEDDGPALTAESIVANQQYFRRIIATVQANTRYPQRALQRGWEGSARVALVLDRNGEIIDLSFLEETGHSTLDREAERVVSSLAPFGPIPDVVPGNRHEFTVPFTFALQ